MVDYKKEWLKKSSHRKILFISFALLLIALTVVVLNIYLQVLQYDEIGDYSSVYLKNLTVQILCCLVAGIISFVAFFLSGSFVIKNSTRYFKKAGMGFGKFPVIIPAVAAGVITAVLVKEMFYREALLFFHSVSFGTLDPIFGKDIGYYIFQRPFLVVVHNFISNLWIAGTIYTVAYYLVVFAVTNTEFSFKYLKIDSVMTHNIINAGGFLIVWSFSFPFKKEDFLFANVVDSVGASFVHVKVWMPYYTVMTFALPLLITLAFYFYKKNKIKKSVITAAIIPVLWATVMVISFMVKGTVATPNELAMENPFLGYNIKMTRQAYGIDKLTVVESTDPTTLTKENIDENLYTIENCPVLDENSVLAFYMQQQNDGSYYTYNDIDIIHTDINGEKSNMYIAVRELNHAALPDKSYINTTYRYTHGSGLVMSQLNKINEKGEPEIVIFNQPKIYYGELTHDYVVVNATGINEINIDQNQESRYEGTGGIPLTFWNRALFALEYRDMKLLSSGYAKNATLMTNRQILQRAQMVTSFLEIDKDPYPVIDKEGVVKWVLDAYTYSDQYPYSQYVNGFNYIRPSVKILIDAYNGNVKYYVVDREDPVIRTYMNIYPDLFEAGSLPIELSDNMKYPQTIFKIQSDLLRKYHLSEDQTESFYTQNDIWAVAKTSFDTGTAYTPASDNRHDMISYLSVGCGKEHYGELTLVHFPRNSRTLGPYHAEININRIDFLSEKMNLLRQSGFMVYTGSVSFVPIENNILYIAPVYIKTPGVGDVPKVMEYVAGYQYENEFVYGIGKNLYDSLENMLNQDLSEDREDKNNAQIQDLMEQLNELKKQLEELQELIENLYNESGQAE